MKKAILIALAYMLLGLLWIFVTDAHLFDQYTDLAYLRKVQNLKGYLFVILSSFAIFYVHYVLYRKVNEKARDLDVLINSTDDMIWSINARMQLVSFNHAYARAIEYARGERPKEGDFVLVEEFGKELNTRWKEYYRRALSGEKFSQVEQARIGDKDIYAENFFNPIWEGNKVVGVSCFGRNITDRVIAEEETSNIKNRMLSLADNLPGAIFQYEILEDGRDRMLYVSDGARSLWGLSPDEIMTNNQLVWEQIHREDLDDVLQSIQESAQNISQWHSVWRSNLPGGGLRWHEGFGQPKKTSSNSIVWDSIILDVTERKNAELRLFHQQELNRFLIDNASDGVLACDLNGKIILHNQTWRQWADFKGTFPELTNWSSEFNIYTPDGCRQLRKEELSFVKALNDEEVRDYPYMFKSRNMGNRFVESNGSSLFDDQGNKVGALVIIRDVTKKTRHNLETTNAILEAIEQERMTLASELHDGLTQELSIAGMNLSNLALDMPHLTELQAFEKARKYVDTAITNSRQLSHKLIPKTVQDIGLISALEELTEEIMNASDLVIQFFNNGMIRLKDNVQLHVYRIVQEALTNIIKHAGAKTVTVRIEVREEEMELTVTDDGKGFDYSSMQNTEGGIGLKTMRSRVAQLKGGFQVESDAKGTTVFVTIPLSKNKLKND